MLPKNIKMNFSLEIKNIFTIKAIQVSVLYFILKYINTIILIHRTKKINGMLLTHKSYHSLAIQYYFIQYMQSIWLIEISNNQTAEHDSGLWEYQQSVNSKNSWNTITLDKIIVWERRTFSRQKCELQVIKAKKVDYKRWVRLWFTERASLSKRLDLTFNLSTNQCLAVCLI